MKNLMKYFYISALLVVIASCNPSGDTPGGLKVISDVEYIERDGTRIAEKTSIDISGDPIIGVVCNLIGYDSTEDGREDFTFYLEYLGDGKTNFNGTGMEFNYILYVPKVIPDTFAEASGEEIINGDPFWWYMKTYCGLSMTDVRTDWYSSLDYLLESDNPLPLPDAEDYSPDWVIGVRD